ncbi:MAG: three component ABC system middle component [Syntrophomonas sp.]
MDNINKEIYLVQNPSIGAAIIWRFVCGYYSKDNKPVPFPLLFLVLPIIFRQDLCDVIKSTQKRSGLSKVSEKLFSNHSNDQLYYVHNSADQQRQLSLSSINIGIITKLFVIDIKSAQVFPLTQSNKTGLSESTKILLNAAEKLGLWCAELTLHEISTLLKVRF